MTRGRKPKPDEMKARQGNPGKRPLASETAPAEPEMESAMEAALRGTDEFLADRDAGLLPPPEVFAKVPECLSEGAVFFWREYTAHLRHLGWVKITDMQSLLRLCEWSAEWWRACKYVAEHGAWYETTGTNGQLKHALHPAFHDMKRTEDSIEDLEDRLGLNPAARQSITSKLAAGAAPRETGLPGMEREPAGAEPAGQPSAAGSRSALGVLNRGRALH